MSGDRKWSYQKLLILAGLVYLAVIWALAIWHLPKSQIEKLPQLWREKPLKEIIQNKDVLYTDELLIVLWGCCIIIVILLNTYKKYDSYTVMKSSKLLVAASLLFTFMSYKHGISVWGGLVLCLWASCIITVLLSVNRTWPINPIASSVFLITIFILFSLIFSFPNTKIKDHHSLSSGIKIVDDCRKGISTVHISGYLEKNLPKLEQYKIQLIEEEHKKAIQEIDRRSQIDDSWFHNKFILVGALFAAFFYHILVHLIHIYQKQVSKIYQKINGQN